MENDRAARSAHNTLNKRIREREREIDTALEAIMQHSGGRRVIFWLLSLGKIGHNPFTGHALSTAHQCGELNVGLQIQERILRVSPNSYIQMLKEMENERQLDTEYANGRGLGPTESGEPDEF